MKKRILLFFTLFVALAVGTGKISFAGESSARGGKDESGAVYVNLGDYARGDGTDETDAIQKAFDQFNARLPEHKGYEFREQKGVLFIPTPPKFYGISRAITITEKANLVICCETPVATWLGNAYFQWLGGDEGEMFFFNFCWGLRVENLSLSGRGKKITGIQICDFGRPYALSLNPGAYNHPGAFKNSIFDHLSVQDVGIGVKVGMDGSGGDIVGNSFRDVHIQNFSEYGFVYATGNGASNTVNNLLLGAKEGAKEGVRITGGQLMIFNSGLGGGPVKTTGAAVAVYAGGVNIYGTWSEWLGPFLYGHPAGGYPASARVDSNARFSVTLSDIQHYPGGQVMFWRGPDGEEAKPESENPAPLSVVWDQPKPLTLINCSFWGGVKLGTASQSIIIDIGTTFSNRGGLQFTGEGIERYGRIIHVGTTHTDNIRVIEPYVVDRRNTPGTEPPKAGVWQKGDRIMNTDPDPAVSSKAWAGWICIESGEPGRWVPFGTLGK